MIAHHFTPCATQMEAFARQRSIQFAPIAPVGCNHDLVLQARVSGYRVGEWEKTAYEDRLIYDGWDKQASLIPFDGWSIRRIIYSGHEPKFRKFLDEYPEATASILKNLEDRGPLVPKECEFQERRAEWKGDWFSPNVTKRILRALWHTGQVMTAGRRRGQHLYDLTERVVPSHLYNQPRLPDEEARRKLMVERHQAVGLVRPGASSEMWSYAALYYGRQALIKDLVETGDLVAVDVDGMKAHATPSFFTLLDSPPPTPRVVFVAPLDQIVWDRKLVQHLFNFDYIWEIYVPEAKRRWGYYVLPILFGEAFVARAEFWCRAGTLEIRNWHWEAKEPIPGFFSELERAFKEFMRYCSATKVEAGEHIDAKVREMIRSSGRS